MILASYIRPFDAKQKIYVLDEKTMDSVDLALTSLKNFADEIMFMAETYKIKDVDLFGNYQLAEKAKREIQARELVKYNQYRMNIDVKGE